MATADDDVIIDLDSGEFFIDEDEGELGTMKAYEAYANVMGDVTARVQVAERQAREALEAANADALLEAAINMRVSLAAYDGAAGMMAAMGLNPEIRMEVEVSEDAEGQREGVREGA